MRPLLSTWIADADVRQSLAQYGLQAQIPGLDYQDGRAFDLYLSLVGELFDLLRDEPEDARDWATLGNALAQAARALDPYLSGWRETPRSPGSTRVGR